MQIFYRHVIEYVHYLLRLSWSNGFPAVDYGAKPSQSECMFLHEKYLVDQFTFTYLLNFFLKAHMGPLKLKLLNTHMESTGEFAEERMNQLRISFEELTETDDSINVILGGDLNMRDKEVSIYDWIWWVEFETISVLLARKCRRIARSHPGYVGCLRGS